MTDEESATPPPAVTDDDEVDAIAAILKTLRPLDISAKRRVIAFVADKHGLAPGATSPGGNDGGSAGGSTPPSIPKYKLFAQLVHRVRPKTDVYRTLLAGYWVQQVEGTSPFGTKLINPKLTEISVGLGHVTEHLDGLQKQTPSFVLSIKQPDQAKKSYMLTDEGIAAVEAAIRDGGFPEGKGAKS